MTFVLNRQSLRNYIQGICFYSINSKDNKLLENYLIIYNCTVMKIYDAHNLIMEKDFHRSISQILVIENFILILFNGGDITVTTFDGIKLIPQTLLYNDELANFVFMRKISKSTVLIFYGPFLIRIYNLNVQHNYVHQKSNSKNFENLNFEIIHEFTLAKVGLFPLHNISPHLDNIIDIICQNNLFYFLYRPDHIHTHILIINSNDHKIISNSKYGRTGQKLISFENYVVLISENCLYFFLFENLIYEQKTNFRIFNTQEIKINNDLIIFNGDARIYTFKVNFADRIILNVNVEISTHFNNYYNIIYSTQNENFVFLKLYDETSILFKKENEVKDKKIEKINFADFNVKTNIFDTVVTALDQHTDISEKTVTTIKLHKIRIFDSIGSPSYIFRSDSESFIVTDKLIRKFEKYQLKYDIMGVLNEYFVNLFYINDFFVGTRDKNSHFFKIVDNEIVNFDTLIEHQKIMENIQKIEDKYMFHNQKKDVGTFQLNEETIHIFNHQNITIQVTSNHICLIGLRNIFFDQIEDSQHTSTKLFILSQNKLHIFSLNELLHKSETQQKIDNVVKFHVNDEYLTILYFDKLIYELKIFKADLTIFYGQLKDFHNIIYLDHKPDDNSNCEININKLVVSVTEFELKIFLKSDKCVVLYLGSLFNNNIKYLRKYHTFFPINTILDSPDYVILDQQIFIKQTNEIQNIIESINAVAKISKDHFIALEKNRILKIQNESNQMLYTQKIHKIKNIDKLIFDKINNVFIFIFQPKLYKDEKLNYFNNQMTMSELKSCNERQEIILTTSNFNKLSSFMLPFNEYVHTLEILNLIDSNGVMENFVVVGSSERCSDEVLKGRLLVFQVIDVVSHYEAENTPENFETNADNMHKKNNSAIESENKYIKKNDSMNEQQKYYDKEKKIRKKKQKTKKALKLLASERTKGTIQAISSVRGKIAVILTTRLMIYEFDQNNGIQAIAFHDLYMYTTGLSVIKNYILVSDIRMGLSLLYFQSMPVKLHLLSRSHKINNLMSCDLFYRDTSLFLLGLDINGCLFIYTYSPHNILSNKGEKMIQRQIIDTHSEYLKIKKMITIDKQSDTTQLSYNFSAHLFSDKQYELSISYTFKDLSDILKVLKQYNKIRQSYGVNLNDIRTDVCFKDVINVNVLKEFLNEEISFQKRICESIDVDFQQLLKKSIFISNL